MKKLQIQLKSVVKSLVALSKQVEKMSKQMEKVKPAETAPAKKKAVKKAVAKKTAVKKKIVKKVKAKKTAAKKKPAKKIKANKAPAKKTKPSKQATVLGNVLGVINRSKKGATIATITAKTGLGSKQLSNALYKLSKKGVIVAKQRGVYLKK